MSILEAKTKLRRELMARLKSVQPDQQVALRTRLKVWLSEEKQTGVWGAFCALPGEPDLQPLLQDFTNLKFAYPRIKGQDLEFHLADECDLKQGSYGIQEPHEQTPKIELNRLSGLFVPGVGFDRQGRRLGRGKGYYDRLLQDWSGLKVGVCFENQIVGEIPAEAHDQRVDIVMTDMGLYEASDRE